MARMRSRLERLLRRAEVVQLCSMCKGDGMPIIEIWIETDVKQHCGGCPRCGKGEIGKILDLTGRDERPEAEWDPVGDLLCVSDSP